MFRKNMLLIILILLLLKPAQSQFNPGKFLTLGTIEATDPDSGEVVYSISAGNSAGWFVITPCSGIVKVDTNVYNSIATQRTYYLKIRVTDMEKNHTKTIWRVVLKKSNGIKTHIVTIQ